MSTQTERILHRLKQGALCSMEPLDWTPRITRTGARIWDLRRQGHIIDAESRCHLHPEVQAHAVYVLREKETLF